MFSGLLLSVRKLYNLGDLVKTNGYFGRIENTMLGITSTKTLDGQEVKQAFDENDVTIPFPIRTLDFGIKGGERLVDVLQADSQTGNGTSEK